MLDAAPFRSGDALHRSALVALPPPRARNVLRAFLREHGLPAPSTARLAAMLVQLSTTRADARVRIRHAGRDIGLYHDRIVVHRAAPPAFATAWGGEATLELPHGTLACVPAASDGIDGARLFGGGVTVRSRTGGERLRTRDGGPLRALKDVLREAGVPPWERAGLPLVYADVTLAVVPGIAADPAWRVAPGDPRGVALVWSPRPA